VDRHAATRRLRHLAQHAGVRITRPHPHMLRHTFVTTMLDAGVDLARPPATTGLGRTSTGTPTTSSPPTWPPAPDTATSPVTCATGDVRHCRNEDFIGAQIYAHRCILIRAFLLLPAMIKPFSIVLIGNQTG
jgi:hypothetical protein